MSINDGGFGEFDTELQDEYTFDAHYPPGVEIGEDMPIPEGFIPDDVSFEEHEPLELQPDRGSGSAAEDGRLEILGDMMSDDEIGSAAMYGPTEIGRHEEDYELGAAAAADRPGFEIGAGAAADRPGSEIGAGGGYIAQDGPSEIGAGPYAQYGAAEIGAGAAADRPGTEIGFDDSDDEFDGEADLAFAQARDEIGEEDELGAAAAADRPGFEIGAGGGYIAQDGPSEIGWGLASEDGESEIGAEDIQAPFESFMLDETRMGNWEEIGTYAMYGPTEIGAPKAVVKVIEKARDNRQPAPPMKAVDVDAPFPPEDNWDLADVVIGASVAATADPFPLTSKLLLRAGATTGARIVRIDTEESYKQFRSDNSPELSALKERLEDHVSNPNAHGIDDDLSDDIEDLVHLGEEAHALEEQKRVSLWMPKRFEGKIEAWREGNFVCVSMALPGRDGEVRICTSLEPIRKCVEEMSRHAAEADVPAATIVGALPAMGCVLGAGTVLKEMAAAAPSILARPEAARPVPFMVRIEPKTSPTLAALAMLAYACKKGDAQACAEWQKLGSLSAAPVRQAMAEALQLVKAAAA